MVNAYDVPASKLIVALTERVKKLPEMEVPEWAHYAKTGSHAERPPQQPDWWYVRAASLLRKLYFRGPLGLTEFATAYGGSKAVAYNPKHQRDAGSSANRRILKQLEGAALVKKTPKGRVLTPKGAALLDNLSKEIFKKLSEENPAITRYG